MRGKRKNKISINWTNKGHRGSHAECLTMNGCIGVGTIFRFGKQKLVNNNQDNQIQSIYLCNMYFSKKNIRRSWGIFENFCVKSNLTVCKVTFNCKLQKKTGGAGCILVAPPIISLGEQLLPLLPRLWMADVMTWLTDGEDSNRRRTWLDSC